MSNIPEPSEKESPLQKKSEEVALPSSTSTSKIEVIVDPKIIETIEATELVSNVNSVHLPPPPPPPEPDVK